MHAHWKIRNCYQLSWLYADLLSEHYLVHAYFHEQRRVENHDSTDTFQGHATSNHKIFVSAGLFGHLGGLRRSAIVTSYCFNSNLATGLCCGTKISSKPPSALLNYNNSCFLSVNGAVGQVSGEATLLNVHLVSSVGSCCVKGIGTHLTPVSLNHHSGLDGMTIMMLERQMHQDCKSTQVTGTEENWNMQSRH